MRGSEGPEKEERSRADREKHQRMKNDGSRIGEKEGKKKEQFIGC